MLACLSTVGVLEYSLLEHAGTASYALVQLSLDLKYGGYALGHHFEMNGYGML